MKTQSDVALHGLLVVDKPGLAEMRASTNQQSPRLPSSHDIVYWVRRWSGEKHIGHTGTLDPMASGVLVLALGHATKLVEYYQGHEKRYRAEIRLGIATDTYDITGQVTEEAELPTLTSTQIEHALDQFRGTIAQIPPAFSAIKQDGVVAYKQARKGREVTLEPRQVTFYQLDLTGFIAPDTIELAIHCSAGTYVRSLAFDLGKALGTVGTLASLRRTSVGEFKIEQAHSLRAIEETAKNGTISEWLLPTGFALDLARVDCDDEAIRRFGFGQKINLSAQQFSAGRADASSRLSVETIAQAIAPDGTLCGLIRCLATPPGRAVWQADKWFVDSQHH